MEQQKPAFNLISITTLEAFFKREAAIDQSYARAKNNLVLNITKQFENDNIGVILTVTLNQELEGKNLVEMRVTTVGVFKKQGEVPEEAITNFCDINGPAIIFPYVREIFSNLSMKGGLQPIVIQPINFVELSKQEKEKK